MNWQITEYLLSPLARDWHWDLKVRRLADLWAVEHVGFWLTGDGEWSPDVHQAVRWLTPAGAKATAEVALQLIEVNGITYAEAVERWGKP